MASRLPKSLSPADGGARLAQLIGAADRIVVFTGAGVSTDCGIPDFRSPGGQWSNNMPISFQDFVASADARREAWRRKFAMQPFFDAATATTVHESPAHAAIRALNDTGRVSAIITQNIDNLHQASGIPAERVIELHGNGSYATCLDCSERHELDDIRRAFEETGDPPACSACGGIVKTATVSFGQPMPRAQMRRALGETLASDLFIALGSSLVVMPAAELPAIAKQNGAALVIVNNEATGLDALADLAIRGDIGETFACWMQSRADRGANI
ncbi:MAG: NAD-dependent deacetylase [Rhodobiaceae bacterium]|nr:Sir2 family NAD-dependent protein deacetylase [Rhodobiaceae bacterium]MCC0015071.1 NAD-dependent deacetylase [Rhodobiaceae bacterium]MCC0052920.1 NAD-dependent deacetylase [Rhodobiaceae bacterium]